jgi:hypothetical protein
MAKFTYVHSEMFARMKDVKERINTNLTSLEYLETLDMFLWKAIGSIRKAIPSLVDEFMVKAIAQQTFKSSTKFSSIMKEEKGKLPGWSRFSWIAHLHTWNLSTSSLYLYRTGSREPFN